MISDRHKFIFVHPPRSGGSVFSNNYINTFKYVHEFMEKGLPEPEALKQVNELLVNNEVPGAEHAAKRLGKVLCWPRDKCAPEIAKIVQKHFLPEEYKQHCADKWKNYYKFGIVRNPWEHLVSLYYMRRANLEIRRKIRYFDTFHEFCDAWLGLKFELSYHYDRYFFIDDEMVLDDVVRFENYNEDMGKIWKNLFDLEMPFKLSKSETKELWKERKLDDRPSDYRELYTGKGAKCIEAVKEVYSKVIEYFDYKF